jgi:hypothetical protein
MGLGQVMIDQAWAHEEPRTGFYVTNLQKLVDSKNMVSSRGNPLTSYRPSESAKMSMMSQKQREAYEQRQENKKKRKAEAEMFLCSFLVKRSTHDLVQHRALEHNQTYDECVYECVDWAMKFEPKIKALIHQRRKLEEEEEEEGGE